MSSFTLFANSLKSSVLVSRPYNFSASTLIYSWTSIFLRPTIPVSLSARGSSIYLYFLRSSIHSAYVAGLPRLYLVVRWQEISMTIWMDSRRPYLNAHSLDLSVFMSLS